MAKDHKAIGYVDAIKPLIKKEEPDWDFIEELWERADIEMRNSFAAWKDTLKQSSISFSIPSDNKPIVPKTAEAVFTCVYCKAVGPQSEGDKHECEEGKQAALLARQCIICKGQVKEGEEMMSTEGIIHKEPLACEPIKNDIITDEAKQLPDLTPKKEGNYLCLFCGDSFYEATDFDPHLRTHTSDETKIVSFRVFDDHGEKTLFTHLAEYNKEQAYRALGLSAENYLWRSDEPGIATFCVMDASSFAFLDQTCWIVTSEKWNLDSIYCCLFCGEDYSADHVDVDPEGHIVCEECAKGIAAEAAAKTEPAPTNKYVMSSESRQALGEAVNATEGKKKSKSKKSTPEVTTH